jgi:hypothetical protein
VRTWRKHRLGIALAALAGFVCACVALREFVPRDEDRGLKFSHAVHVDQGLDCDTCHSFEADATAPDHELCSICHDIPEDLDDLSACNFCHTREDYSIDPRTARLDDEVIFGHEPHLTLEQECAACHEDVDKRVLPKGDLMAFCMDCHGKTAPEMQDCAVCHSELREDVRPSSRGGQPLPHDVPAVWERIHGQEFVFDPAYCAICHTDTQADCEDCHQREAPADHTLTWRRRLHGLKASWDRNRCAVCHEEDSCQKCHDNTTPSTHRGSFGPPRNTHCTSCHIPVEPTRCVTCHEAIEHPSALRSPHADGAFPPDCSDCHPGGNPLRAPHPQNNAVRCAVCHS